MKNSLNKILLGMVLLSITSIATAKNITMYEEPKTASKNAGELDSQVGVITIFSPKNSEWIKVADPRDGKVGWIKSNELNNTKVSFNMIQSTEEKNRQHLFQTSNPSIQRINEEIRSFESHQRAMGRLMHEMFADSLFTSPLFIPVVVVQERTAKSPQHPVKQETTKNSAQLQQSHTSEALKTGKSIKV
jgi:hypothetical protein